MKLARVVIWFSFVVMLVGASASLLARSSTSVSAAKRAATLDNTIADNGATFEAFVGVLRNPRCMNCHSTGDYPRQGDDGHRHTMNVHRGPAGFGVTAEKCSTCHQDHNLAGTHLPPGAPNWHLPPPNIPMIWEGLSDAQICESIKDPKQNRGRNLDQLVEHLTEDKLVMWGWNPGEGRTPIPMPHDEFSAKVKAWQAAGAPCPAN
jgi:hypothetical protein